MTGPMTTDKKILMIAATPFFSDRGCHIRIYEEMRHLKEVGYDPVLCAYGLGDEAPGVHVTRSFRIPWYSKRLPGASWHKLYLDVLLLITALRSYRREKPDVIHAHLYEGLLISFFLRAFALRTVPIIFDCQGSLTEEMDRYHFSAYPKHMRTLILSFLRALERALVRIPDRIICSSEGCKDALTELYGAPKDKITIVEDGIREVGEAIDAATVASMKARFGIPPENEVVIYAGSLSKGKGVKEYLDHIPALIEAAPRTSFLFVGYGDLQEGYERAYRRYVQSGQIVFTGRVSYFDLYKYLCLADRAVDPKRESSESSAKLLGYLSQGIPTYCFRVPIRDLADYVHIISSFSDLEDALRTEPTGAVVPKDVMDRHSWARSAEGIGRAYELACRGSRIHRSGRAMKLGVAVAITALFVAVFVKISSVALLFALFKEIDPAYLALSFFAYLAVYLIRGFRLSLISGVESFRDNFVVSTAHTFFGNMLPASLGELSYPLLWKKMHMMPYSKSVPDLVLMRGMDLLNLIAFALGAFVHQLYPFGIWRELASFAALLAVIPFIACIVIRALGSLGAILLKFAEKNRHPTVVRAASFVSRSSESLSLHDVKRLFKLHGWSVAIAFAMIIYGVVAMKGFGVTLPLSALIIGAIISIAFSALPIDGFFSLGITQAGWAGALAYFGVSGPLALALSVNYHILTLLFCGILFLFACSLGRSVLQFSGIDSIYER